MAGGSMDVTNIKIQNSFGFTLLEILISIFIFAIVITTVFGSYNFVLSSSETVDKAISSYEMGLNCLNRMIVDLESIHLCLLPAYSPPDFDDFPDTYRIAGDISDVDGANFSRLRFTSLAHVPIKYKPQSKLSEIVYYVQAGNENDFVLKRANNMCSYKPFEEKKSDPVLCENIKSLTFIYYDQEGAEHENWDSDLEQFGHETPVAISIKLEIGNDSDFQLFETVVAIPVHREKTVEE
jgi:general secretion pathway protein J